MEAATFGAAAYDRKVREVLSPTMAQPYLADSFSRDFVLAPFVGVGAGQQHSSDRDRENEGCRNHGFFEEECS